MFGLERGQQCLRQLTYQAGTPVIDVQFVRVFVVLPCSISSTTKKNAAHRAHTAVALDEQRLVRVRTLVYTRYQVLGTTCSSAATRCKSPFSRDPDSRQHSAAVVHSQ